MKELKPDEIVRVLKTEKHKLVEKQLHKKYSEARIPQTEYFRLTSKQLSSCKKELSIYYRRRSDCNPLIIGLASAIISPLCCIYWVFRQRSIKLLIIPFLFLYYKNIICSDHYCGNNIGAIIKLLFGIFAYFVSKQNKISSL